MQSPDRALDLEHVFPLLLEYASAEFEVLGAEEGGDCESLWLGRAWGYGDLLTGLCAALLHLLLPLLLLLGSLLLLHHLHTLVVLLGLRFEAFDILGDADASFLCFGCDLLLHLADLVGSGLLSWLQGWEGPRRLWSRHDVVCCQYSRLCKGACSRDTFGNRQRAY